MTVADPARGPGNRPGVMEALAAAILVVIGLPIGWLGISIASDGIRHGPGSGGLFEVMLLFGLLVVLVAALHIAAAAQIWAGRSRRLGLIIATIGTVAGAVLVWLEIGGLGLSGRIDSLILAPVPYLFVLLVLWRAQRQSRRLPGIPLPST